ncbi:hypothetical protein PPL_03136 [Heterostelium album PN500]|uniref:DUSP domain-containing protein n=1 Tax=Heterostelium pallidum (strain ATCC 26659 / Pp 5 / PN500) TaxID=670386 RepID=D3B415_HETP5|nr:hypothetical protein PPL_03136 [Heterostelium album PN500]EFA84063.1 hypothetical protein PPL_03136 [Heterostelium album PN500]|eukprot:XP_020436180.1 hypothetical protein PPL_03136 [Heterostelium album PN500]
MVDFHRIMVATVTIGVTFFTCMMTVLYYMFPCIVLIRPFSYRWYLAANNFSADLWYRMNLFIFEIFNGITVKISGDDVPDGEGALIMMNHPSEVDWIFTWCLGVRKKSLSNIKIILKDEIKYVPAVGWGCDNLDFIYLTRDWTYDEKHLQYRLEKFKEVGFRSWLTIFPEGTDMEPEKLKKSHDYADRMGYPKFNNVLLPRHKGVQTCLDVLRPTWDAVYDITIGYESKPTIGTCFTGVNPKVVNIHVNRIPIKDVPTDEKQLQDWLFKLYAEKDKLLENLKVHKQFPKPRITPLPQSTYLVAAFWFSCLLASFYFMLTSSSFRIYTFLTMVFYIVCSKSNTLRTLRVLTIFGYCQFGVNINVIKALSQFRRVNDLYKHVQESQKNVALFHLGHWVKLKVGGTPFIVRRRTLTWYPGSVFESIAIYDKNTTKKITDFITHPFLDYDNRPINNVLDEVAVAPLNTDQECSVDSTSKNIMPRTPNKHFEITSERKNQLTQPTKPSFKFEKDTEGYYLIDRDSGQFSLILNYLRSGEIPLTLPTSIDINMLLLDSQFYRLYDLEKKLTNRILSTRRDEERMYVLNSEMAHKDQPPYFIIDKSWVIQWRKFIDEEGEPPKSIDNTKLFTTDGSLKKDLELNSHYICVSKDTWMMIAKRYPKSGPIMPRATKDIYSLPIPSSFWDTR